MMIVPVHYQDLEPAQKLVARTNSWVIDHRTDLVIECFRDLDRNGGNWNARIPGESRGNGSRAGFHWEETKHEMSAERRRILHVMLLFLYLQR